jgi:DNA (cytosine-5)-methyltransferase 1
VVSAVARKMLVADLLCGAGGSSTGCARALAALGLDMELVCVNHWPVAIDTHRRNHPEARHYVQDIATVRPHLIVPEGYLDLLMASPTCTHHSVARGGRPTSDQQRADPWHIVTWLTELRVKRIIIENVWEFTGWGPVDPRSGRPIRARKGEYFRAWIDTIRRLGFEPEWKKLNAADYGDATTRSRFILMARSDRRAVSWPAPTHRRRDETGRLDLFPGVKPWRPARDIIDWSIRGRSIFGRKKPLAPKTLARIYAGAVKFNWPAPFLVILRNHMAGRSLDAPLPALAASGTHVGLAQPVILSSLSGGAPRSAAEPLPTITTGGGGVSTRPGCARPMLVEPFVVAVAHGNSASKRDADSRRAKPLDDPLGTVHAGGGNFALVAPYYGSGSGETCQPMSVPLPTVTAKARFGMVLPVTHNDVSNRARDVDAEPLPTLTAAHRGELAFITAQHGEREGQSPRVHSIDHPAPAICASGHIDLVEPGAGYDILFRMLEPHELAAAMGFHGYQFAGTKTEQIKQIGNAVSVAKMTACVGAMMADAAPPNRAAGAAARKAVA